jgi:organic radical activating enzyme
MSNENKSVFDDNALTCQFKWGWSTIFLNTGTSSSCHRCRHYTFDEETIINFHNLPGKLKDRQKMLNGEWPGNGCEYCRDVEVVGGISERVKFVNKKDSFIPNELFEDPSALVVSPTILEVYFNNLCNQSCIYCRPRFSSQIEQEVRFHGPSKFNEDYSLIYPNEDKIKYKVYLEKFLEYMKKYGKNLKHFKMLGGEPLYQDEFNMLLDLFNEYPCPNLKFEIFTNLNHSNSKLVEKVSKLTQLITTNKIKEVQFNCSIDCWGPDVEYIRNGFEIIEAENNINLLLDTSDIKVQIHATISALSLPSMYILGEKVKEWQKKKPIYFSWNTIQSPTCFNVYNFGNTLVPFIDKFIATLGENIQPYQRSILGVKTRMLHSTINKDEIIQLYNFLNELDIRRNKNWKIMFPEIVDIINRELNV